MKIKKASEINVKYFISRFIPKVPSEESNEEYMAVINGITTLDKEAVILEPRITKEGIRSPLLHLSDALKLMNEADFAVFIKGWTRSKICQIEYQCAAKFGISIREGYLFSDKQIVHLN